jgi:hypothetical protein
LWEKKISQTDLAEEVPTTRTTVYHAVRGSVTEEMRKKLSAALKRICERRQIEFMDPFGATNQDGERQ